jgi:hypothetical protein
MSDPESGARGAPDPKTVDELFLRLTQAQGIVATVLGCCSEEPGRWHMECSIEAVASALSAAVDLLDGAYEAASALLLEGEGPR